MQRFEDIGTQIMRRTGSGGPFDQDPLAGVMSDKAKRAMAAQILGQAYFSAHKLIEHNRDAVEQIADVLVERREMHGDEVLDLLQEAKLELPEVDLTDEKAWPKL
jgi:cell division protease FtsH